MNCDFRDAVDYGIFEGEEAASPIDEPRTKAVALKATDNTENMSPNARNARERDTAPSKKKFQSDKSVITKVRTTIKLPNRWTKAVDTKSKQLRITLDRHDKNMFEQTGTNNERQTNPSADIDQSESIKMAQNASLLIENRNVSNFLSFGKFLFAPHDHEAKGRREKQKNK